MAKRRDHTQFQKGGRTLRPAVAAAFAYLSFMWGSTYLFIKVGLDYWPPFSLASARNLLAGLAMALVIAVLKKPWPENWRAWWPPLAFGVINGTSFAFIFWGEQYIPSGQSALLIATMPLFTLFLAWWWNGEGITGIKAVAVAVGLAGVFLATGHREGAGFVGSDGQRVAGQMAMLAAAVCYAASYVFGKKYFKADIFANTAIHLGSSGVYLLVLAILFDPAPSASALAWEGIGSLLYLALPGSALAYWCMFYLMQNMNSVQTTYVTLLNPIVALLLGVTFMGESLTLVMVAGAALVLLGVWLINRPKTY